MSSSGDCRASARASASSISLPMSVSNMTGTGCCATRPHEQINDQTITLDVRFISPPASREEFPHTSNPHNGTKMTRTQLPGKPYPQGATGDGIGVNFSLYSETATGVELCLFDDGVDEPAETYQIHEVTGTTWNCDL